MEQDTKEFLKILSRDIGNFIKKNDDKVEVILVVKKAYEPPFYKNLRLFSNFITPTDIPCAFASMLSEMIPDKLKDDLIYPENVTLQ